MAAAGRRQPQRAIAHVAARRVAGPRAGAGAAHGLWRVACGARARAARSARCRRRCGRQPGRAPRRRHAAAAGARPARHAAVARAPGCARRAWARIRAARRHARPGAAVRALAGRLAKRLGHAAAPGVHGRGVISAARQSPSAFHAAGDAGRAATQRHRARRRALAAARRARRIRGLCRAGHTRPQWRAAARRSAVCAADQIGRWHPARRAGRRRLALAGACANPAPASRRRAAPGPVDADA